MSCEVIVYFVHCLTFVFFVFFYFYWSGDLRYLHSFPTRRSSDLHFSLLCDLSVGLAKLGELLIPSGEGIDRKSTRLNSSHVAISYAVFCLKKKKNLQEYSGAI